MSLAPPPPPPGPVAAGVVFIGRIDSGWARRQDCPRSIEGARQTGRPARITLEAGYRAGLHGLAAGGHVILLYWMDEAERDVLIQYPHHGRGPRGVFAIRSPARPNPIALAIVRLHAIDPETGLLVVDPLDCRDGTPLVDLKPYRPDVDRPETGETQADDVSPARSTDREA